MKNIEVWQYLSTHPDLTFRGLPRSVVFDEQGFHTDYDDPESENKGAYAFVLLWQKLKNCSSVEQFLINRYTDMPLGDEGGLHLGLRYEEGYADDQHLFIHPGPYKKICAAIRAMGTAEEAQWIAEAREYMGAEPRDREKRVRIGRHPLLAADVGKAVDDLVRLDAAQVESLAAGYDGRQYLVAFGCRKHELHVRRRFLKRLQERVPRGGGKHMAFVDDENLEAGCGGLELHGLDDGTHVLHLVVRGAVQLHDVKGTPFRDLNAVLALAARFRARRIETVQSLGEDAAGGCFADSARPDEKVGVRYASGLDRVLERTYHVFLPDDVVERHRAVLQRQRDMLPTFGGLLFIVHWRGLYHRNAVGESMV